LKKHREIAHNWVDERMGEDAFKEKAFLALFNPLFRDAPNKLRSLWCFLWIEEMARSIQRENVPTTVPEKAWQLVAELYDMPDGDPSWPDYISSLLAAIDDLAIQIADHLSVDVEKRNT
jgi:hypothetical protein